MSETGQVQSCVQLVIKTASTYVWYEADLVKVIAELGVMEGDHLGENSQVL